MEQNFHTRKLGEITVLYAVGGFNIKWLSYKINTFVKKVFHALFSKDLVALTTPLTRVTRKHTTSIEHILNDALIEDEVLNGMVKTRTHRVYKKLKAS